MNIYEKEKNYKENQKKKMKGKVSIIIISNFNHTLN